MMPFSLGSNPRRQLQITTFLVVVGCVGLSLYWHLGTLRAASDTAQLQWLETNRKRGVDSNLETARERADALRASYADVTSRLYGANTQLAAETALLERVTVAAHRTEVTLLSTQLLPVESLDPVARLSVELRGRGRPESVLALIHELSHTVPTHTLAHVRLDAAQGNGEVTVTLTASALVVLGPDAPRTAESATYAVAPNSGLPEITLFGRTQSPAPVPVVAAPVVAEAAPKAQARPLGLELLGIVYGNPLPVALVRASSGSSEQFVRVGDAVGEVRVIDITRTHMTVEWHDQVWQLHVTP